MCGSEVLLTHINTMKNLHSHHHRYYLLMTTISNNFFIFRAPLTNNQEVSAYGNDGAGDAMDVWEVICGGNNPVSRARDWASGLDLIIFLIVQLRSFVTKFDSVATRQCSKTEAQGNSKVSCRQWATVQSPHQRTNGDRRAVQIWRSHRVESRGRCFCFSTIC